MLKNASHSLSFISPILTDYFSPVNHIITPPLDPPQEPEHAAEDFMATSILGRDTIPIQGETNVPPVPEVTDAPSFETEASRVRAPPEVEADMPTSSSTPVRPISQSFVMDTIQDMPFLNFAIHSVT